MTIGPIGFIAAAVVVAYMLNSKLFASGLSPLQVFAQAIAFAEGAIDINANPIPNVIPTVRNNPGDLEEGGGDAQSPITYFPTPAAGWAALYAELALIQSGNAFIAYGQPLAQFAVAWTGNDNAASWTTNVIFYLDSYGIVDKTGLAVSPQTLVSEIY
jgi:hypothetical protein